MPRNGAEDDDDNVDVSRASESSIHERSERCEHLRQSGPFEVDPVTSDRAYYGGRE